MQSLRRRLATAALVATVALGLVVQPVAAIHQNAVVDCGDAGTYVLRTAETGAGLYPPSFVQVDLLTLDGKMAGALVPFRISINGEWLPSASFEAAADAVEANVGFATCSFTGSNGDYVVLVGLLNLR